MNEQMLKYRRTPYGLISQMASAQRRSSRERNHPPPEYTTRELYVHAMSNARFIRIFIDWIKSDYNLDLTPSVDRINSLRPYTWDNIQFVTAHYNMFVKGAKERGLKRERPVFQICMTTNKVLKEYQSIKKAGQALNKNPSHIGECARHDGVHKTAYGFKWEYKKRFGG